MTKDDGNNIFQNICNNNMSLHDLESLNNPENPDDIIPDIFKSSHDNIEQCDVGGAMCDGCEKLLTFINNGIIIFEIDKYHCNVCNYTDLCEDCFKDGIEPIHGPNNLMCQTKCNCEFVKSKNPELNKIPTEFLEFMV